MTFGDSKVVTTVNTDDSHHSVTVNDKNKIQSSSDDNFTMLAPNNDLGQVVNQTDQVKDITLDPDKYALNKVSSSP